MPTVTEPFEGRPGGIEAGGQGNEGIQRNWTRRFRVIMDRWDQTAFDVVRVPGIPRIGDTYPSSRDTDRGARCHNVKADPTQFPRHWDVTADYTTEAAKIGAIEKEAGGLADPNNPNDNSINPGEGDPGNAGGGGGSSNGAGSPLSRAPKISYTVERYSKVAQIAIKDIDTGIANAAIASAAGEPFDPPVEIDAGRLTLTITRNEAQLDPVKSALFQDAVNTDLFLGLFGPGTVKCNGIGGETQEENGVTFASVTYSFSIRNEGWRLKVLNQGLQEWVGGQRERIVDNKKEPILSPVPLDAAGAKLTVAAIQAGNFTYKTFQVYNEREFSPLNLP